MSGIQSKISRCGKKENITHKRGAKSIKTNRQLTQMIELANKDIKRVIMLSHVLKK